MTNYKAKQSNDQEVKHEFVSCGTCFGTGLVHAETWTGDKTGVFICGCYHGSNRGSLLPSGSLWATWGDKFKNQCWSVVNKTTKKKELGEEYQTKAKEFFKKASEGVDNLLEFSDQLFDFDRIYPNLGWFKAARFFLKKHYLSKGFDEKEIEMAMPSEN